MAVLYDKAFYGRIGESARSSAESVVPLVVDLLGPVRSVVDLGCGVGAWLSVFQRHGAERVLGVDGDYVPREQLYIAPEEFQPHDLSRPIDLSGRFDLAVSLEVAEHLPAPRAQSFVATLTALAPAVLFGAAIPHQGGTGHVNEQWPEYWARLFEAQGYVTLDPVRPAVWRAPDVAACIAQNTLLYVHADLVESSPALQRAAADTRRHQLSLVHPDQYGLVADPARMSFRRSARALPASLASALRRRLTPGRRTTDGR